MLHMVTWTYIIESARSGKYTSQNFAGLNGTVCAGCQAGEQELGSSLLGNDLQCPIYTTN